MMRRQFFIGSNQLRSTPEDSFSVPWRESRRSVALAIICVILLILVLPSWSALDFNNNSLSKPSSVVHGSVSTAEAVVDYVILISIDGLRPDAITSLGPEKLPNLCRFRAEGAWTDNARTDRDYTLTLPNHTTMLTGRGVIGSTGHSWSTNSDPTPTETLHSNHGSYVASLFDVAHDNGSRTGAYVSKSKFSIYDQSYDEFSGAEDITGPDNGKDKIDTFRFDEDSEVLVDDFISVMRTEPFHLSFLHLRDPDAHGHGTGWMQPNYLEAVEEMDRLLGRLFDLVENDPVLTGNTTIIVTSDHGGTAYGHTDSSVEEHYVIPFYTWGKGVTRGVDLYTSNANSRQDPQFHRTTYTTAVQPIRNGDAANLALSLLGLGNVPGSTINTGEKLSLDGVGTQLPVARFTITPSSGVGPLFVQFDASASTDVDGVIVAYDWDFGDGNSGSGETASHTYASFGRYAAKLKVTDDFGATGLAEKTIAVRDSHSVTVSFQDGMAPTTDYRGTRDTKIRENSPGEFFGSDTEIEVDGDSDKAGLLKWDLSSIPANSTILSAEIILEITNGSTDTYEVYELRRDWEEGESNWYQYSNGNMWQVEGANGSDDRGSDVLGSFDAEFPGRDTIRLDQAAMTAIKGWVDDPSTNHGFILLDYDDSSSDGIDFDSREVSTEENRPKLTVTYTPPVGTAVDEIAEIPTSGMLLTSYPNPFQTTVNIQFEVQERTQVHLEVVDLLGRRIVTLIEEPIGAGTHDVVFNAEGLPSGIYLARLTIDSRAQTSKIILRR
ncbi:MAG: DNRLRE domain-containing protein [Rhodothermaceae bacterium]|nr:DNRLRE domain-containing protein [Rhodothermaceae bacterium]MYD55971.1 DNRLRE domain-containing protein [Rhodothermaceae bacterium]MYJ55010.1 DNRLRE domain-containing protein [Rhodothermaceae bacterium]